MDKNDTIVTDVVIHALKMDDTIKRQEIMIERLRSDKNELLAIITKMKEMLVQYAPDSIQQLELFKL
jgi:riboflavin synthase